MAHPTILEQMAQPQQAQETVSEKILMKAFDAILQDDNIEMKTDVNQRQINAITKGLLFAQQYDSKLMKDLCDIHMKLLVSKGRKGRTEITQMTQSINTQDDSMVKTLKDKLF